jgi:hypothetical protein
MEDFEGRQKYPINKMALLLHFKKFYSEDEIKIMTESELYDLPMEMIVIESKKHMFNVIITLGMSSMEMTNDQNIPNWGMHMFAELMICVPNRINSKNLREGQEYDWILNMLRQAATFPHIENTWLGIGHGLQGNMDGSPYDDRTEFIGGMVLPSVTFDKDFTKIPLGDSCAINIYSFFPLYRNELDYKIANNYQAMLDLLTKKNMTEVFLPGRENLLSPDKKKRFKLW